MSKPLDLNLLRLFAEVHRLGSVSRAAEALGMTQPAATKMMHELSFEIYTSTAHQNRLYADVCASAPSTSELASKRAS